MAIDMTKLSRAHCIGIGGIGLSGLADLLKDRGVEVSGSDAVPSEITERLAKRGIAISVNAVVRIDSDVQLVIRSAAVPDTHPEVVESEKLNIPVLIYPSALAQFAENYPQRIVVSGTNGKSTTTAMIATIFENAGVDPTALVGSLLPAWINRSSRLGKSDTMIMEACEWRGHMMLQKPTTLVLTNLELEHTDYYKDMDQLARMFEQYINTVPDDGVVVVNKDRKEFEQFSLTTTARIVTYGKHPQAQVRALAIKHNPGKQVVDIQCGDAGKITIHLSLPGDYNGENVLAAVACAYAHHLPLAAIEQGMNAYQGIWRRFQYLGAVNNAAVYSDYAHHPDALRRLISGAKSFDPSKRLTIVFQPHQHRRTKDLFKEFTESFDDADKVIITDIYDVTGREAPEDQDVHATDLSNALTARGLNATYIANLAQLQKDLRASLTEKDLLIVAGAGDIYLFAEAFIKAYGGDR